MSFIFKLENIPTPLFQSDSSLPTPALYRKFGTGNNDRFYRGKALYQVCAGGPTDPNQLL